MYEATDVGLTLNVTAVTHSLGVDAAAALAMVIQASHCMIVAC